MRLDVALFERGLVTSRTEAKGFIQSGAVSVGGIPVTKPAFEVSDADEIDVDLSTKKYVSRGGLKLEAALDAFGVDPSGRYCLDVGASSGGFTDCLLKRGALAVCAVDSGTDQLVAAIRQDKRVTSIEGYNARYMSADDLPFIPTLAVMDVSFISATYIITALSTVLPLDADFICLVKPQFEVGRANLGKGGIVKDDKVRLCALKKVTDFADACGFDPIGNITSPIKGGDGNTEYLVHFKKR